MFERFHRVEGTPRADPRRLGIGLALVRDLVELHGGTISIASEPGRGSVFTVSIPFGSAHLPKQQVDQGSADGTSGPGEQVEAGRGTDAVDAGPLSNSRAKSYVTEALRWVPTDTPPADAGGAASADPSAARVLVVDDNADMRTYVCSASGAALACPRRFGWGGRAGYNPSRPARSRLVGRHDASARWVRSGPKASR